jgi:hypothetical protein
MRRFIFTLMVIQAVCFGCGVIMLVEGDIAYGVFNVVLNSFGFCYNISLLKNI